MNGRPNLISSQMQKLYTEIQRGGEVVRERKLSLRMLLDVNELQSYLQDAFDHISQTVEIPFDFIRASYSNRPIASNFGGIILRLAVAMMNQETRPDGRAIFNKLAFLVASCIMLDAVRNNFKGKQSCQKCVNEWY
jgi:hypothetical protein